MKAGQNRDYIIYHQAARRACLGDVARGRLMAGEEPVNPHVFNVEPYGRLLRRYRWRCSCGAGGRGFITKTSAVFYGDTHAMQSNQ